MDKENIIEHFGEAFYTKVLNDLEKYASQWSLSEFEQVDYYSVNCIFKCVSDKHGLCVLKTGNPSEVTGTEYHILKEYNGKGFCKIYEADTANGVLLIERITPGTQLRAEPDLDKRLDIFCNLFRGLHVKTSDKTLYPTYMEWVSDITKDMREHKEHENLYGKMAAAEQICRSLCEKYPGKMLLHGDLHHENILLGKDNLYRIIDPKGVIGDSIFDIPRFILNEFDDVLDDNFYKKFVHITRTFSEKLKIPEYDIRRLTYVEMCMATCLSVDSGRKLDIDEVAFTEKLMSEV